MPEEEEEEKKGTGENAGETVGKGLKKTGEVAGKGAKKVWGGVIGFGRGVKGAVSKKKKEEE